MKHYLYPLLVAFAMLAGAACAQPAGQVSVPPTTTTTCNDDGDVDTLETLCTIDVRGYEALTLCGTVATAALSDFDILISADGSTFVTMYTASADYTSPAGFLHSVSADPTTWTTTPICIRMDGLAGLRSVRFSAAGTSSDPSLTVRMQ